ncbi:hypothetical protein GLOIN_2v1490889 [Rhizophagus irregularis DAOM 181602=DAOM 197198]|uniref:Uncharacterized protein n=1 Tax=Rhizophagus irregularis (strain DAOM 181602 / DAOM 197198 / MUCL 43194) TaxID=747089 RepID=U9UWZ2_RHIID|nr:hypothetical protein GLOIN_2v1490889 [Rhizophagus irregularis DAOM 181602=DAOM 197198]POG83275.1 hypothetical protein GLOIN_2v1490889 [Rhizophagus irregularis DAOM 181602=DAOM 197198]GBC44273.1 hypothetical protein GLOIN_2v1490889 [Rhizophagus irregularis DAOM 181602=DAOM 197198]|eukprot:XP_025190141.1 hypothetical protein GLOIN_2v1490889 [Rhizophagus irregularis DAOM 181602=DAOM 197198]
MITGTRGVRFFLRSIPVEVYPLGAVLTFAVCYGIGQTAYKLQNDRNLRRYPSYYGGPRIY